MLDDRGNTFQEPGIELALNIGPPSHIFHKLRIGFAQALADHFGEGVEIHRLLRQGAQRFRLELIVPKAVQAWKQIDIHVLEIHRQKRGCVHHILVDQVGEKAPFPAVGHSADCHFRRGVEVARKLGTVVGQVLTTRLGFDEHHGYAMAKECVVHPFADFRTGKISTVFRLHPGWIKW